MKEHLRKVIRVEDVQGQSVLDARTDMLTAHRIHTSENTHNTLQTLLTKYQGVTKLWP